jgi:hypothetical protein
MEAHPERSAAEDNGTANAEDGQEGEMLMQS